MKRKAIYKLSFKEYLKAIMIFIVFIMICSISFFFYIKKDIKMNLLIKWSLRQKNKLKV